MKVPPNGWFIVEKPIKMYGLGVYMFYLIIIKPTWVDVNVDMSLEYIWVNYNDLTATSLES